MENFCREVCIAYCETNSKKLGGPGKTVEVDEAKFGKRKYNKCRVIDGKWVFAGLERESKDIFIVAVQDLTKEFNCLDKRIYLLNLAQL